MTILRSIALAVTAATFTPTSDSQAGWTGLVGTWEGSGTFQGKPTVGVATWDQPLGGKWQRQVIALTQDGRTVFEGHGFYPPNDTATVAARWFDSQGNNFPVQATWIGDSLVANWGPSATAPIGRTVYHLIEPTKLLVSDYFTQGGANRLFAKMEYRRKP